MTSSGTMSMSRLPDRDRWPFRLVVAWFALKGIVALVVVGLFLLGLTEAVGAPRWLLSFAAVILGAASLAVAKGLADSRRWAWWGAVALCGLDVVQTVAQVASCFQADGDAAAENEYSLILPVGAIVALVVFAWLLPRKERFN